MIGKRQTFIKSNDIDEDVNSIANMIIKIKDEFITDVLNNDLSIIKENFRYMIVYISHKIPKINYKDLDLIDRLFDIYCELCLSFNRNPTLDLFYLLFGLCDSSVRNSIDHDKSVLNQFQKLTDKWTRECKHYLVGDLSTSDRTSVNKIFIAKAQYGLYDQPQPKAQSDQISSVSLDLIMQKLNAIEDKTQH